MGAARTVIASEAKQSRRTRVERLKGKKVKGCDKRNKNKIFEEKFANKKNVVIFVALFNRSLKY
jgi:hypothetical protein